MKTIKTTFITAFAILALSAGAQAFELQRVKAADIPALAPSVQAASADEALDKAVFGAAGPGPVIITVPGLSFAEIGPGRLELKYLFKLINFFFPKRKITEHQLEPAFDQGMREYFMLEEDEPLPSFAAASPASNKRVPDDYLEAKLRDLPGFANSDIILAPFRWSRDPDDTDRVIPELTARLAAVYDAYKGTGRPIYIVAHSWGSILSHTAMHRVKAARPDVRIDRWITLGSPLVPGNVVVDIFVKVGVRKEHFEKTVSKPANLAQWRNIWAERDVLSNAIQPADVNYKVDGAVDVESQLINLILFNKPLKKLARADLLTIRNPADWHSSYFYDYKAYLKSLEREVFVPVFRPVLAPQITAPRPS
jgi:hypothetical protein